jgi:hypothetical protein
MLFTYLYIYIYIINEYLIYTQRDEFVQKENSASTTASLQIKTIIFWNVCACSLIDGCDADGFSETFEFI